MFTFYSHLLAGTKKVKKVKTITKISYHFIINANGLYNNAYKVQKINDVSIIYWGAIKSKHERHIF